MELYRLKCVAGLLIMLGATSAAAPRDAARPQIFDRMVACRAVADPTARLACYDAEVAAVDAAEKSNELVVVDRDQVRKARRSLFGLSLPKLAIFSRGKDGEDEDDPKQIDSVIRSAYSSGASNRSTMILEDGAKWVQIDSRSLSRTPRPGMKIRIRRAALGSYVANIDDQTAIRVHREN